uniref:Hedgehog/Intein (Hint) domain-containing protein n=1 Tax=viral metagenome TaxID=1070528 RepID=A0A6C0BA72_9ZZZZ
MATLASYSTLKQYVILATNPITTIGTTTVTTATPTPLYGSSLISTGIIDVIGATLNNNNAAQAQTELGLLTTAISNLSYPNTIPASITSNITFTSTIVNSGNYIFSAPTGTPFNQVGVTNNAGPTLTFDGPGNFYIYADEATTGSAGILFLNFTMSLINGALASNIYWYASGTNSAISDLNRSSVLGSGLSGIFISGSAITINNSGSVINGNLYAQSSDIVLTSNIINPETNPLCFLKGTKILTDRGYFPIEELKIEDNVIIYGLIIDNSEVVLNEKIQTSPIRWIGKFVSSKHDASTLPICFKAGSLGENLPENDLFVSPGHRMILDGKMHVAKDLVNGETIVQEDMNGTIEYYHFELDCHSVIMAEGVLTETFFEFDNSKLGFQ